MPHRAHLTALRFAGGLRDSLSQPYGRDRLIQDLIAGVTVGIIAIPLSMALAIAVGAPPQHGLYTAMIAGAVIALSGGSRYSVSGPTAAFIVILHPVVANFGLGGLAVATLMAGALLVLMAVARLGRLIEYIPASVTLGFTGGIAIVIATLQVKDFAGLAVHEWPESYVGKVGALIAEAGTVHGPTLATATVTLMTLLVWRRLGWRVPGHLPAVIVGIIVAKVFAVADMPVATIGDRFSFIAPDGSVGAGIPPFLPAFDWPWNLPGPDGQPLDWDWATLRELLPAAFSIAMLGAIESLLCAVVLDGMTRTRHQANGELLGQGLGNLLVPFFGGITATAALARSAANVRAGAQSPVAAVTHAAVVLLGIVALAPVLAMVPMATMAALLVMVAWSMSEAPKIVRLVRRAPLGDVAVLATCMGLTVLFDMVIAIGVGIVMAALLFMRNVSEMTRVSDISEQRKHIPEALPDGWKVFKINGPLFFAAADRVFTELELASEQARGIVLYLDGVSVLDAGGLHALEDFIAECREFGRPIILADLQFQPLRTLTRAHLAAVEGEFETTATLASALARVEVLAAA